MGIDKPTPGDATRQEAALVKQEKTPDLFQTSIDGLNQWLVEYLRRGESLPRVSFGNVDVSIQAGPRYFSTPRSHTAEKFTEVELGFPSEPPPDYIMEYMRYPKEQDPTRAVYAYVPIELVVRWAAEKGGAKALPAPEKEGE